MSTSSPPSGAGGAPDAVIDVRGLVKRFGRFRALDGLDLRVERGEVLGFLGPNGSGKTTTIRVLLGQIRRDGGTAAVFGRDPWADPVRIHGRLAYVPGDVSLWPSLTGGECIDTLLRFHGGFDPAHRDALVKRFDLDVTKKARTYSKGNRQKVALVAALASDAELLILDEPTSGLDPLMEDTFRSLIRERVDNGDTVLLSSHILSEVEALCDRVTIIRRGRAIETGTLDQLREHTATTVQATFDEVPEGLDRLPGVGGVHLHPLSRGTRVTMRVTPDGLSGAVHAMLHAGGQTLAVQPPSLDELFLARYQDAGDAG